MKFALGYFYQVRFFTPNMIPISTAVGDPKWYHQGYDKDMVFFDKNNVVNGLRCSELAPGRLCEGLCNGSREFGCEPQSCNFLKTYRLQLEATFNIEDFLIRCERVIRSVSQINNFEGEPVIVLLVHEAPDNPCSERQPLLDFFNSHGVEMKELII